MRYLYHGSTRSISEALKPHVCYELQSWLYATDDFKYALVRAGNFDISKPLIRQEYDGETMELAEVFPGAFKEVFDRPGYIYLLDPDKFEYRLGTEYVSGDEVSPVCKITIDNVLAELKKWVDVKLIKYEDTEAYWKNVSGGREGYLARKARALSQVKEVM